MSIALNAQIITVDSCWHLPIGTTVPELSAVFGDMRPNHFHMGLDFRTNGREGIPLYAIANGYVSRIRVFPGGYGRVLYIDHPNGLTSVYAHCSQFSDRISKVIYTFQYATHQNEVDIKLHPNQLPVVKGEQIALSGNSGNSTGPHLHFELRDTKTEHALNPLLHGFHVSDQALPNLHGIRIVAIDENGFLLPGKSLVVPLSKLNHHISIPEHFIKGHEKLGVCISATDPMKTGGNGFGLFSAEIWTTKHEQFGFELAEISFDDSRYVNNHMDYDEYKTKGIKFQKLFRNKCNPLTIYQWQSMGGISLHGYDSIPCSIMLEDVNGNVSQHELMITYPFEFNKTTSNLFDSKSYFLPDSSYSFYHKNMHVFVDDHTFYEPVKKSINLNNAQFGTAKTVIQKSVCIEMKAKDHLPTGKQFISVAGEALETKIEGEWLTAESKQLGIFSIKTDTIAPNIQFMPSSSNVVLPSQFSWKIGDAQSGILSYELWLDGKWTLVYFDQKNNLITWKNDQKVTLIGPKSTTLMEVELQVTDRCGNKQVWKNQWSVIDESHLHPLDK
ncbi:MAG: M23 family metallopeptidase [Flavobacteriales bacterium]